MAGLLLPGDVLSLRGGGQCKVVKLLGGGAQGEVYLVSQGAQELALKWYLPTYLPKDPELAERLGALIDHGPISDRFLWPLDFVKAAGKSGWGYLMPLRPGEYVGIVDLKWGANHPQYIQRSYRFLAQMCDDLVANMQRLHLAGFCYVDLNPGNIFISKSGTGGVRICDLDNVCFANANNAVVTGVAGFMAPEVMQGLVKPNVNSDRHSLAVVLFDIFMVHHPLVGRAQFLYDTYDDAMPYLFGSHPAFIFDDSDRSNYALSYDEHGDRAEADLAGARAIARWNHLPGYLRDLFVKAFTVGLKEPNARVTEGEWRRAFLRMADSAFPCPGCGNEVLYDPDRLAAFQCPFKGCDVTLPYRIRLNGNRVVMLNLDTALFPHHIDPKRQFDFSTPVAQVLRHPNRPGRLGLKNLTEVAWKAEDEAGRVVAVDSGRSVGIESNLTVDFGLSKGVIRL